MNTQLATDYREATCNLNDLRKRQAQLNEEVLVVNNLISKAEASQNKAREALLNEVANG